MTGASVRIQLAVIEATQLAHIIEDFRDLVGTERDLADPAVARLTPSAYPDDNDAAQEFQQSTRNDLLDRRANDAQTVLAALAPLRVDLEALTNEAAFAEHEVTITEHEVDGWLRTLTAVRLVLATRLGITDDEERTVVDPAHGIYDWLGYRLELLIQAADELL